MTIPHLFATHKSRCAATAHQENISGPRPYLMQRARRQRPPQGVYQPVAVILNKLLFVAASMAR
jgi:hypothetical protein